MSNRTMCLDWRGAPNLMKAADLYSVGPWPLLRPTLGNPKGRVLVSVSATILYTPDGQPSPWPYNLAMYALAKAHGALTDRVVWSNSAGYSTRLFDATKRGMVREWMNQFLGMFGWANGAHLDYASAWSWQFPDMAPSDAAWESALSGFLSGIRQSGRLALAQQWQTTPIVMAGSGAFLEQSPTSFGSDFDHHASEITEFRNLTASVDQREVLYVSELREPAKFPDWYRVKMRTWAEVNDVVLSWGRDAQAGVGL